MNLADNYDMHKISDKFANGSGRTNDDRDMTPWFPRLLVNTLQGTFSA